MSAVKPVSDDFALEPADVERLANLCGQFDDHLHQIENRLKIQIVNRGNLFSLRGEPDTVKRGRRLIEHLYKATRGEQITPEHVHLQLQESGLGDILESKASTDEDDIAIRTKRGLIRARGPNQQRYLRAMVSHDINLGIGPAGTGKTYLAVAYAVESMQTHRVQRIILVRPAVEAGERLGFLPGDLAQKVDPYLRPLYDALYEMLGFEKVAKLMDRNVIEVAPLAYMRGRTLNDAFVILDEAQNTTPEQMKMFLTRIGFGSTAVVTGDPSQVDLPKGQKSGLAEAIKVLEGVEGISMTYMSHKDVVRHPVVARIVQAYDRFDKSQS